MGVASSSAPANRAGTTFAAELKASARNPAPSGATVGLLDRGNGAFIRYALWPATASPRRGTVCVFTGRAEFIEKYFETVDDLRSRGFAVAIMDWRGQGGSSRALADVNKGHIDDFDTFEEDVRAFMRHIVLPDCPAPYFALAHSMGGHIVLRMARTGGIWFDRMVLSAPMIKLAPSGLGLKEMAAGPFAGIARRVGLGQSYVPGGGPKSWDTVGFEQNVLTSDPERFARARELVMAAPEIGLGSPTNAWLAAASRSMAMLESVEFPPKVTVPILMFAAGNDRVVSTPAIEAMAKRLKTAHLIMIPGAQHEILQERDEYRAQFWAGFDSFVPGSKRA